MVEHFLTDNSGECGALCSSATVFNFGNNSIYWMPFAGSAMLWFCFGLAQLLPLVHIVRTTGNRWVQVLILLLSDVLLLAIFGWDLAVWSFLAVFSLACLVGGLVVKRFRMEISVGLLLAIASFLLAGVFSLSALLLAAFYLLLSENRRGASLVGLALCFSVVLGVVATGPQLPNYPSGAEVVPSYHTVDGLTPFIGDQLPIRSVNLAQVRERVFGIIPLTALLIIVSGVLLGFLPWLAAALLLCAALDSSLLRPFYAQMMPIQSLSRILPGGLFYPLSYLALAGSIVTLSLELRRAKEWSVARCVVFCSVFAVCIALVVMGPRRLYTPENELRLRKEFITGGFENVINSPSCFVLASVGTSEIKKRISRRDTVFSPVGDKLESVVSAAGPIDPEVIADGKGATGWHTDQAVQRGNEWLEVLLSAPVTGIKLDTGVYFSDFPRGIRVRYLESCPTDRTRWQSAPIALNLTPNHGDVFVTDEGYPYFGQQYSVSAFLPPGESARCFYLEQTGQDENYAWTVADLLVAPATEGKGTR